MDGKNPLDALSRARRSEGKKRGGELRHALEAPLRGLLEATRHDVSQARGDVWS
jgi:hypothetical protein